MFFPSFLCQICGRWLIRSQDSLLHKVSIVKPTCHVESITSLQRLILDAPHSSLRCFVPAHKACKCSLLPIDVHIEAQRALLAINKYMRPKVPSRVKLPVHVEPCHRCHAAVVQLTSRSSENGRVACSRKKRRVELHFSCSIVQHMCYQCNLHVIRREKMQASMQMGALLHANIKLKSRTILFSVANFTVYVQGDS